MMLPIFDDLIYQTRETQEEIIQEGVAIASMGQEETLRDFCRLSAREQNQIISYIGQLPLYEEAVVNGTSHILVHGGLPDFSDMPLEYYDENELLFGPHDFFIDH